MGLDNRKPVLPAPTESLVDTTGGSATGTGTDLATDLSRRTDKTSYSVPEDGSPVLIPTSRRKNRDRGDESKLSRASQNSQTSLLIEYFEGGKGSGSIVSRPSVRVRVTPSSKKLRDQREQVQISDSSGSRKPSYARRISLGSPSKSHKQLEDADEQSISSDDNHHQSRNHPPFEIEFVNREQGSELSNQSRDHRYFQPTSDISSMPPDSLLDGPSSGLNRKRSQSSEREERGQRSKSKSKSKNDLLKTPARKRSRSLSTERIAHRVAEKLTNDPEERKHLAEAEGEDGNKDTLERESRAARRRARRQADKMASPESSMLSASTTANRRSGDQFSVHSGVSNKSSINNPRLLETVEDAIRRLILPELKELKKDQKVIHNTSKFDRDLNASSQSTTSRDELGRRLSKHASAPDVMKPKVVLNKDSKDEGTTLLAGEPAPAKKERKASKDSTHSETDPSHVKWANRPDMTEHDKLRRQRSKGLRDAEAAGRVGTALTAAALQHHDSRSSLDKNESRRPSVSRSRAGSVNETELVFQKHNVAPMPLRSALDSEMTRDSLVSQRTAETETTSPRKTRMQEVSRESPTHAPSPLSRTPNQTPLDARYELGLRHSNKSNHNVSIHSVSDHEEHDRSHSPLGSDDPDYDAAAAGDIAAAAVANLLDGHGDPTRRRTLSPIQSVASEQSDLKHHQQSQQRSVGQDDDNRYYEGEQEAQPRFSIDSLSSAPSTSLARSTRPSGLSLESQSEMLKRQQESGHELGYEDTPRHSRAEDWDEKSEAYSRRHSMAETSSLDPKRMTNYTEDSELDYMDKIHEGQHISNGTGANPQFIHPMPVESAVASLLDPSVLEARSTQLGGNRSQSESDLHQRQETHSPQPKEQPAQGTTAAHGSRQGSPLKQRQDASSPDATSFPKRMGVTSPPQSVTQSIDDHAELGHSRSFDPGDDAQSPIPEAGDAPDSESEINTNPSIIQGPGLPQDDHDYWPYGETTPSKANFHDEPGASKGLGLDDELSYDPGYYPEGAYAPGDYFDQSYQMPGTPPAAKDEGYVSGAHPVSPSLGTPKSEGKGFEATGMGIFDSPTPTGDDDFGPSHQRNLSGYSHGVGSPLYDSATGKGVERIQSKDIIALMDHVSIFFFLQVDNNANEMQLTVRDAQRNARDTEILVSLVRSAAEMRNSFEEMKKFIAYQDGLLMEANDKQHDRTYRALGGPRPQPPSNSKTRQFAAAEDGEEMRSKRKNVFKRVLKGLSFKSNNDLTKIEDMLEQLLDDVEDLRAQQDERFEQSVPRSGSVDQDGYEAEGEAGTSSTENHSGHLSSSSRPVNGQRMEEHRVSTVPEADEENEYDERGEFLSPQLQSQEDPKAQNATAPVASGALNEDATPPKSNEKARKHKSGGSFFPKFSRWSKNTASSMGDNIRNSIQPARKERNSFDASRSGDLAPGAYNYDPQGDDRIRSRVTFDDEQQPQQQQDRPPSPLVPSQVSEAPKYRAHRDSMDLQHPQPRQGPTGRYQTQLESQAQVYGYPSPHSEQWGSNSSLAGANQSQTKRHSNASRLSPISDAGYSEASSRHPGPPRPPKVKDDGPLVPERPPKVKDDEERSYADRVTSRSSAMRSSPRNSPPARKPTGPRPLNSGSQYSRTSRYSRATSPDQVDDLDY